MFEEITLNADATEYDEDFKLISRIILSSDRKDKNTDRRCSLIGVRS
jgi:hypothetical protein